MKNFILRSITALALFGFILASCVLGTESNWYYLIVYIASITWILLYALANDWLGDDENV